MVRRILAFPLVALSFMAIAAPASAQRTAAEILRTASERYEARVEDIDNYTLIQEIDGNETVAYYEREERNGRTVFVPVSSLSLALESGYFDDTPLGDLAPEGGVLEGVRDAMLGALAQSGLSQVQNSLAGAGQHELAEFVSPFLETAQTEGGFAALKDPDRLKDAFLEGAKRAGMEFAISQISKAALGQFAPMVDVLRGKTDPDQLLGALGKTIAGGGPGGPGGGAGGGQILSSVAQAGLGALASYGARKLTADAVEKVGEATAARGPMDFDVYGMITDLERAARLTGSESVDGREAWVLVVDDLSRLDVEAQDDLRDASLTMWWDQELYVPLRFVMEGEVQGPEGWIPITVRARFERYEDVEGLLLPHRTTTAFEGMAASIPEEERQEMKEQLKEMEEQLAELPPEQRAMAEQMMKSQMPQLKAMLDEESQGIVIVVKEVRVNEGPPQELLESIPRTPPRAGG
ncbi:MAG: hypothetical protein R3199_02775 [Gemmatimonadota bacterium]|nr:hypothetical protein [Gemmatimonadota bacterium]